MKYTKEVTDRLIQDYTAGREIRALAAELEVPERSVIAKLSSLGVYKKREYLNKRGEVPRKKSEYIERIAELLDINLELLESLEKVNKNILALLEQRLDPKSAQPDQADQSDPKLQ